MQSEISESKSVQRPPSVESNNSTSRSIQVPVPLISASVLQSENHEKQPSNLVKVSRTSSARFGENVNMENLSAYNLRKASSSDSTSEPGTIPSTVASGGGGGPATRGNTTGNSTAPASVTSGNNNGNGGGEGNSYCVKWTGFEEQLCVGFANLYHSLNFSDVTIACEGELLKSHKVVLGMSSPYFRRIFEEVKCKHPVIILHGIKLQDMKNVLRFVYLGEVNVKKSEIDNFLSTAECLKIDGILGEEPPSPSNSPSYDYVNQFPPPAFQMTEDARGIHLERSRTSSADPMPPSPVSPQDFSTTGDYRMYERRGSPQNEHDPSSQGYDADTEHHIHVERLRSRETLHGENPPRPNVIFEQGSPSGNTPRSEIEAAHSRLMAMDTQERERELRRGDMGMGTDLSRSSSLTSGMYESRRYTSHSHSHSHSHPPSPDSRLRPVRFSGSQRVSDDSEDDENYQLSRNEMSTSRMFPGGRSMRPSSYATSGWESRPTYSPSTSTEGMIVDETTGQPYSMGPEGPRSPMPSSHGLSPLSLPHPLSVISRPPPQGSMPLQMMGSGLVNFLPPTAQHAPLPLLSPTHPRGHTASGMITSSPPPRSSPTRSQSMLEVLRAKIAAGQPIYPYPRGYRHDRRLPEGTSGIPSEALGSAHQSQSGPESGRTYRHSYSHHSAQSLHSRTIARPKTKAIRSSQVPQSARYTAAEVDSMVDKVQNFPGNMVPCAICQKFVKRERLRAHIHECHLLQGKRIMCPHCGIGLKSKGSFRVHIWRHKKGTLPTRPVTLTHRQAQEAQTLQDQMRMEDESSQHIASSSPRPEKSPGPSPPPERNSPSFNDQDSPGALHQR